MCVCCVLRHAPSTHPVDEDVSWQSGVGLLQAAEAVHHPAVVKGQCDLCQTASCHTQPQMWALLKHNDCHVNVSVLLCWPPNTQTGNKSINSWKKLEKELKSAPDKVINIKNKPLNYLNPVASVQCWRNMFLQTTDTFTFIREISPLTFMSGRGVDGLGETAFQHFVRRHHNVFQLCLWRPKLDLFRTITKSFLCLNQTRPSAPSCARMERRAT